MAEGKRVKFMKDGKEYEMRKMPFSEIAELSGSIVNILFLKDKETGELTFLYPYQKIVTHMFEMAGAFPDIVNANMNIFEFAEDYLDGVYDDYIAILDNDPRARYLENSINIEIENIMRYSSSSRLLGNVNRLVTTITDAVEKYSSNAENINPEDVTAFIQNFGEFAAKANPDSITEAVIKMHQKDNGAASTKSAEKKKTVKKSDAKQTVNSKESKTADESNTAETLAILDKMLDVFVDQAAKDRENAES